MPKMFYKIGEVSHLLGIDSATLRYWERAFPMLKPRKNSAGHRIYSSRDMELITKIVKLLHEEGYTLNGAKKRLGVSPAEDCAPVQPEQISEEERLRSRMRGAKKLASEILTLLDRQKGLE